MTSIFRQAGVAYHQDAGQTWTASILDPGQFRSDPVLDFDANGDEAFHGDDLAVWQDQFGDTSGGGSVIPAEIPEPNAFG